MKERLTNTSKKAALIFFTVISPSLLGQLMETRSARNVVLTERSRGVHVKRRCRYGIFR
jgi:hypothetical protein